MTICYIIYLFILEYSYFMTHHLFIRLNIQILKAGILRILLSHIPSSFFLLNIIIGSRHVYSKGFKKTIYLQVVQIMHGIQLCPSSVKVAWAKLFPEDMHDDGGDNSNNTNSGGNNTSNSGGIGNALSGKGGATGLVAGGGSGGLNKGKVGESGDGGGGGGAEFFPVLIALRGGNSNKAARRLAAMNNGSIGGRSISSSASYDGSGSAISLENAAAAEEGDEDNDDEDGNNPTTSTADAAIVPDEDAAAASPVVSTLLQRKQSAMLLMSQQPHSTTASLNVGGARFNKAHLAQSIGAVAAADHNTLPGGGYQHHNAVKGGFLSDMLPDYVHAIISGSDDPGSSSNTKTTLQHSNTYSSLPSRKTSVAALNFGTINGGSNNNSSKQLGGKSNKALSNSNSMNNIHSTTGRANRLPSLSVNLDHVGAGAAITASNLVALALGGYHKTTGIPTTTTAVNTAAEGNGSKSALRHGTSSLTGTHQQQSVNWGNKSLGGNIYDSSLNFSGSRASSPMAAMMDAYSRQNTDLSGTSKDGYNASDKIKAENDAKKLSMDVYTKEKQVQDCLQRTYLKPPRSKPKYCKYLVKRQNVFEGLNAAEQSPQMQLYLANLNKPIITTPISMHSTAAAAVVTGAVTTTDPTAAATTDDVGVEPVGVTNIQAFRRTIPIPWCASGGTDTHHRRVIATELHNEISAKLRISQQEHAQTRVDFHKEKTRTRRDVDKALEKVRKYITINILWYYYTILL